MPEQGLVLAACPTYVGKEPVLDKWLSHLRAQTYPDLHIYAVDNTVYGMHYFETLKRQGIDVSHVQPWTDATMQKTFHRCWELILERAEQLDAYWVLSMEADNGMEPEGLQKMVDIALYAKVHLVSHNYRMHQTAVEASGMKGDEFYYNELGVTLMSRRLLERALVIYDEFKSIPLAIWAAVDRFNGGWCKLTNCFETYHWDCYETEFPQFQQPAEGEEGFCPTPKCPEDYGTVIPPSLKDVIALQPL